MVKRRYAGSGRRSVKRCKQNNEDVNVCDPPSPLNTTNTSPLGSHTDMLGGNGSVEDAIELLDLSCPFSRFDLVKAFRETLVPRTQARDAFLLICKDKTNMPMGRDDSIIVPSERVFEEYTIEESVEQIVTMCNFHQGVFRDFLLMGYVIGVPTQHTRDLWVVCIAIGYISPFKYPDASIMYRITVKRVVEVTLKHGQLVKSLKSDLFFTRMQSVWLKLRSADGDVGISMSTFEEADMYGIRILLNLKLVELFGGDVRLVAAFHHPQYTASRLEVRGVVPAEKMPAIEPEWDVPTKKQVKYIDMCPHSVHIHNMGRVTSVDFENDVWIQWINTM
jgi:hypothetical protein